MVKISCLKRVTSAPRYYNPKNLDPKKIGLILEDGSVKFGNQEAAIEHMKNRCMASVRRLNPFEREGGINGTLYVGDADGTLVSCNLGRSCEIMGHSHPDTYARGCTSAPSSDDYYVFINSKKCNKMYVFNSNGEYYWLEKIPGVDLSQKLDCEYTTADFDRKLARTLFSTLSQEEQEELEGIIGDKYLLSLFAKDYLPKTPQEMTKAFTDKTHEFWVKFGEYFGVKAETNFSNFADMPIKK